MLNIASNKKATYDYIINEKYEVGLVLTGAEVKSLRMNTGSIKESYIIEKSGELWLTNCHIKKYFSSNQKNYGGFTRDFSSQMLFGANEVELGKQWANNKLLNKDSKLPDTIEDLDNENIDFALTGEGEFSFLELADCLINNLDVGKVPGFVKKLGKKNFAINSSSVNSYSGINSLTNTTKKWMK